MFQLDPRDRLPHASERNLGLDLVRAIAILMVLVAHWANNFAYWIGTHVDQHVFFAGDVGVELFFALSGFLIGRILLEIAQSAPSFHNYVIFMVRRWMRTLPLYALWLAVLFTFFPPAEHRRRLLLQFATLTQNLFHPMPPHWYFAVSWSLTVEEWFYLLFGLALIGATLLSRRTKVAFWLTLALFLAGPLALRIGVADYARWDSELPKVVFFRIDEIAYGVLMARLYIRHSWLFRHPLPPLCAGLLLIGVAWSDRLPVPWSVMPILIHNATIIGCALCLPAALRLRRAPAWAAATVRMVSAQSYALYLMHETIMVDVVQAQLWGPGRLSAYPAMAVAVVLPFTLSWLSFRLFESPILALRPAQSSRGYGAALAKPTM
jgi:peptidoglycan/LPS O-acetylase OafA/YrhL